MSSVNRLTLVGRVGNDPECRYTNGGNLVVTLSVATSQTFKNKAGQKITQTEWHHLVLYRQQAEFAQQYITKGRLVFAEGRVQSRKYTDKQGVERTVCEVICERIQNLPDGRYTDSPSETAETSSATETSSVNAGTSDKTDPPKKQSKSGKTDKSSKSEEAPASPPPPLDDPGDDIPF